MRLWVGLESLFWQAEKNCSRVMPISAINSHNKSSTILVNSYVIRSKSMLGKSFQTRNVPWRQAQWNLGFWDLKTRQCGMSNLPCEWGYTQAYSPPRCQRWDSSLLCSWQLASSILGSSGRLSDCRISNPTQIKDSNVRFSSSIVHDVSKAISMVSLWLTFSPSWYYWGTNLAELVPGLSCGT